MDLVSPSKEVGGPCLLGTLSVGTLERKYEHRRLLRTLTKGVENIGLKGLGVGRTRELISCEITTPALKATEPR